MTLEDTHVAEFEIVKKICAELALIRAHIAEVDDKANRAFTETQILFDRITLAEEITRSDSLRMAQLESGPHNL